MKKILKTYKSIIILLAAIIIGAILGMAFKRKCSCLKTLWGHLLKFIICYNSSISILKYYHINIKNKTT